MIIAISLVSILTVIILAVTAVICTQIFSSNKYSSTNEVAQLQAAIDELSARKSLDPKEFNDRMIACENRLNISIGARR